MSFDWFRALFDRKVPNAAVAETMAIENKRQSQIKRENYQRQANPENVQARIRMCDSSIVQAIDEGKLNCECYYPQQHDMPNKCSEEAFFKKLCALYEPKGYKVTNKVEEKQEPAVKVSWDSSKEQ